MKYHDRKIPYVSCGFEAASIFRMGDLIIPRYLGLNWIQLVYIPKEVVHML